MDDYIIDDFKERIREAVDRDIQEKTTKLLDELADPETITKYMVVASQGYHNAMREYFDRFVATEVGNRLRCGINGTEVDKLFEKVWTEQFDKAMEDKINRKLDSKINELIRKKLQQYLRD